MDDKFPATGSQSTVSGSGAIANKGGAAAGAFGTAIGGDQYNITNNHAAGYRFEIRSYLRDKGPRANFGMGDPARFWDTLKQTTVSVEKLREILLNAPDDHLAALAQQPAQFVSVEGQLYPCGLLVSGWWESHFQKLDGLDKLNGVQKWLFNGFHAWGPSFDFSWDFDKPAADGSRPRFVAQLGSGDEANSIPVIIPADKAHKLRERFQERGRDIKLDVSPLSVTVEGVLCGRSQCPEAAKLGKVGGILDYCIWLKEGESSHRIQLDGKQTDIYSGYLWKCVAPKSLLGQDKPLELHHAYFLWEHTNFANEDSVKYNLDSLDHKQRYLEEKFHRSEPLVVLQKSNILVRGDPYWTQDQFYKYFQNREDI